MSKKKNPTGETNQPDPASFPKGSAADDRQAPPIETQPEQKAVEQETADIPVKDTSPDLQSVQKEEVEPQVDKDTLETPVPDALPQGLQDTPDSGVQTVDLPEQAAEVAPDDTQRTDAGEGPVAQPAPGRRFKRIAWLVVVVLLVAGGLLAYSQFARSSSDRVADTSLIEKVGRLVVVPPDEVPKVSTVVDPSQTDQPFLANAQKGDKVLLYLAASRAIVYRPSTGQIVNMGPLVQPQPRLFVRNGTNKPISESFDMKIKNLSGYQYISQDKANDRRYAKTIVIDVTGSRPDVARRLAEELDVSVGELPEGESRPDADVLIITGSDISSR